MTRTGGTAAGPMRRPELRGRMAFLLPPRGEDPGRKTPARSRAASAGGGLFVPTAFVRLPPFWSAPPCGQLLVRSRLPFLYVRCGPHRSCGRRFFRSRPPFLYVRCGPHHFCVRQLVREHKKSVCRRASAPRRAAAHFCAAPAQPGDASFRGKGAAVLLFRGARARAGP